MYVDITVQLIIMGIIQESSKKITKKKNAW